VIVIACSCGKKSEQQIPIETQVIETERTRIMDRIVLSTLSKLNIEPIEVGRENKPTGIHYIIPVNNFDSIEIAELHIHSIIERIDGFEVGQKYIADNMLMMAYVDTLENTNFLVEFLDISVRAITQAIRPAIDRPILCIIIDDFGQYDGPLLDAFNRLDPAVTFAVLPGLPFSRTVMQKAVSVGREVIVHIPMEADNISINPGSNAILSNMSSREIYERVQDFFKEINLATGANQHMGSKITQNRTLMRATLRYFSERDFYFIDSRTTPNTVARELAEDMGIAFAERDLFLDSPDNTDEVLEQRLQELRKLLETKGRALVITHCFDRGRLQRLERFITEAKRMGWELVPASAFVERKEEV
jgi:hypothetical protein